MKTSRKSTLFQLFMILFLTSAAVAGIGKLRTTNAARLDRQLIRVQPALTSLGWDIYHRSEWGRSPMAASYEAGMAIYHASERNTAPVDGWAIYLDSERNTPVPDGMAIYHASEWGNGR